MGTVREDYSQDGGAWMLFPMIKPVPVLIAGEKMDLWVSLTSSAAVFAIALWNETDPILKERLYGLTGSGSADFGNHGEDVKEYYFYLENTPTHSYMKGLYKYHMVNIPMHIESKS
jgi:hypothetical protein